MGRRELGDDCEHRGDFRVSVIMCDVWTAGTRLTIPTAFSNALRATALGIFLCSVLSMYRFSQPITSSTTLAVISPWVRRPLLKKRTMVQVVVTVVGESFIVAVC